MCLTITAFGHTLTIDTAIGYPCAYPLPIYR